MAFGQPHPGRSLRSLWPTVDAAAVLQSALAPIVDDLYADARAEGRKGSRETLEWDALVEMAETTLDLRYQPGQADTEDHTEDGGGDAHHVDPNRDGPDRGETETSPGASQHHGNPPMRTPGEARMA